MAIEFPADKFVNDTYDYNGLTYVWDGEKWTASGAAAFEDVYVNIDGDTMTGDLTVPSLNDGPLAGFRNVLINSTFQVQQRKNTTGEFVCDRWYVRPASAVGGTQTVFIGETANGQLGIQITTSGATGQTYVSQTVEAANLRMLQGQEMTFSCRTDFPNPVLQIGIFDSSDTKTTTSYTLTDNGTGLYTATFTLPTSQIGQTLNSRGMELVVFVNGESTAPSNGTYTFRNPQLEPGPVATPFEHRPLQVEQALCQRYCFRFNYGARDTIWFAQRDAASENFKTQQFNIPVPLRVFPSFTPVNFGSWNVVAGGVYPITPVGLQSDLRGGSQKDVTSFCLIFNWPGTTIGGWEVTTLRSNYNDPALMPYFILDAEL